MSSGTFSTVIGRPGETEYTPWGKAYVGLVDGEDIVTALSAQLVDFMSIFSPLDLSVAATYRYAAGKWSINDLVGHMADTERIFACRALRIARGDQTPLPGFEQDDYVATADFNRRTLNDLLGEFETVRHASIQLFRGLPDSAWQRRGQVSGHSVTTRGIAFQLAGHERYHARILREKYIRSTEF